MRLIKLHLRGAIGILKGIGREEIEIDFTQYNAGLIALTGKNGTGKTTIIENLHPYRRLVSRDGNLADHFALKDSFRKLTFVLNGTEYRSEIYIDGLTKKTEAYLFANGQPLNDGKVTTYDEAVRNLLGSEDLFFNSVFTAQMSEGLAHLTASERRELFYELLNLNKYEIYCEKAKLKAKEIETEIARLGGENEALERSKPNKTECESKIAEINRLITASTEQLQKNQNDLREFENRKEYLIKQLAILENEVKEFASKSEQINKLKEKINEAGRYYDREIANIELWKAEQLKVAETEYNNAIARIGAELRKVESEIKNLEIENSDELEELDKQIANIRANISKLVQNLQDEDKIKEWEQSRVNLEARLKQLNSDKINLIIEKQNIDKEEQQEYDQLVPLNNKITNLQSEIKSKQEQRRILLENKETLLSRHNEEIKNLQFEIETLNKVPCANVTSFNSRSCPFLQRAYKNKDYLPVIQARQRQELQAIDNKLDQTNTTIIEAEYQDLLKQLNDKNIELIAKYQRIRGQIQAQLDKLDIEIKTAETELNSIPHYNLEELNKVKLQLTEAQAKLNNLIELRANKEKTLKEVREAKLEMLTHKRDTYAQQLIEAKTQYNDKISKIGDEVENKINLLTERHNYEIAEAREQLSKLEAEVNKDAALQYQSARETLATCQISIETYKTKVDNLRQQIMKYEAEIEGLQKQLREIERLESTITDNKLKIKQLQNDYRDYNFLIRAFDKTGIPVLKLEVLGKEITAIANDLLQFFDSDFRVVFETTQLTKDKKKLKEVFAINIVDENGVTELKNKSGGQQVWIETAIKLAVGIVLRSQGKNIQTVFLDEQDGALDLDNALNYRAMIEEAHKRSGVYHTIIITHRKELQDLIDQTISLQSKQLNYNEL